MKPIVQLVSMHDRRVMITGASSGIGKAMASRFAEAGADLVLLDVDEEGLAHTEGQVRGLGCDPDSYLIDLNHKDQVMGLWERFSEPVPDTLINNAAIYPMKPFLDVDEGYLDKVFHVNLESVFWMCQGFIQRRGKAGGTIVNVSSIEAVLPFKSDMAPYSVSKAGVLALTRSLSRDYAKQGFRVNSLVPGGVNTPGTKAVAKQIISKLKLGLLKTGYDFQQRLPAGRMGEPDEVATVALFLASDMASYVHGAAIPVDGGFLSA